LKINSNGARPVWERATTTTLLHLSNLFVLILANNDLADIEGETDELVSTL